MRTRVHHNSESAVNRRSEKAFTLIELIISAALTSMILASSYICLNASLKGRKLVQQRSDAIQTARVALDLIAADLRSATALSEEFEFLGMHRAIGEMEADNMDFATHRYSPKRRNEGDFCEVSYYVSQDEETGQQVLYRRRDSTPDPEPLAGGTKEEIATGIKGLSFTFYDGFEWWENWGDAEGSAQFMEFPDANMTGMPEAVRIAIAIDPDPKINPAGFGTNSVTSLNDTNAEPPMIFSTVVRLNLAALRWAGKGSAAGNSNQGGNN
jgi:type II secretion system protein J